jgi:hypothetical protein
MVQGTASGQFTGQFIGNVLGTSSWSETASVAYNLQDTASQAWTASFVQLARSASFTVSASYVVNAQFATSSLSVSSITILYPCIVFYCGVDEEE